jgi:hypothetical protein
MSLASRSISSVAMAMIWFGVCPPARAKPAHGSGRLGDHVIDFRQGGGALEHANRLRPLAGENHGERQLRERINHLQSIELPQTAF